MSSFSITRCTENHLSIECRESSATSVLLEVDYDNFLPLMNFTYLYVSGNAFFFFFFPLLSCPFLKFATEPKLFCSWWLENFLPTNHLTWRKTVVWSSAWIFLIFFFLKYHQLTCLASAEAWDWLELCQTNIEMYLLVRRVPSPFCCTCVVTYPRSYLLSSLLTSGSFGVRWWLFRFTWPFSPFPNP